MPTATLGSKTLRELQRKFKKGYTVEAAGRSKFHVLDPEGQIVRSPRSNAPLILDNSPLPSERRNIEAELKEAEVIEVRPRRVSERKTAAQRAAEKTRIEDRRKLHLARAQKRQTEINALHDRLAKVIEPVGGWDRPGMQADLAHVGLYLAQQNGNEHRFTVDRLAPNVLRVSNRGWVEPRYQEVWNAIAERLEKADDVVEEWFDLVRAARDLPEVPVGSLPRPKRTDWPFDVMLIPLEALFVDHSYQRPVDWFWVRKTAASYDERLVGTIDVSTRRHERYAILDGQGRYEASKLVGKSSVWCSVYRDFTVTNEAAFFLHKNKDRKAMHPFYTFRARLAAEDPDALEIEKIVQANGYRLAISDQKGKLADAIPAISSVEETFKRKRRDGTTTLIPTLEVMKETTYALPQGNNGILIRGLSRFFEAYTNDQFDWTRLQEVLTKRSPAYMLGRARAHAEHGYRHSAMGMVNAIVTEYNNQLARKHKLAPIRN